MTYKPPMLKRAQTSSPSSIEHQIRALLDLIHSYKRAVAGGVRALRQASGFNDPLRAWRAGKIPQSGRLGHQRTSGRYTFHGVGCRFELNGTIADADFAPDGRYDGFDLWRLRQFASDNPQIGRVRWTPASMKRAFTQLAKSRQIRCPAWEPSPHLYYLTADLTQPVAS